MVTFAEVVAGFLALVLAYSAFAYLSRANNDLAEARAECERAWGNVEVLLERRYDEVRDLVDLAVEHTDLDREVLAETLVARERLVEAQNPENAAFVDVELRSVAEGIYGLADEYPDLRSHDEFDNLRERITDLENRLENRREFYNEAVAAYNARLHRFPETLFASLHGFDERQPFTASEGKRDGVDVRERIRREA